MNGVRDQAEKNANERLVDLLVPSRKKQGNFKNPFEMIFGGGGQQDTAPDEEEEEYSKREQKQRIREKLLNGELEDEPVTVEVEEQASSMFDLFQGSGMEQMGMSVQDALGNLLPKKQNGGNCRSGKQEKCLHRMRHRN